MESLSKWLKDCWEDTGGIWLWRMKWRKKQQRRNLYWHHQAESIARPPHAQPRRKLTVSENDRPDIFQPIFCQESLFLKLPVELQLLIWEHAFGGHLIALYRDNSRLTHVLLDKTITQAPAQDKPIQIATIQAAVQRLPKSVRKHGKQVPHRNKLGVLALLQSCRSM
jgi:hypothetical protein